MKLVLSSVLVVANVTAALAVASCAESVVEDPQLVSDSTEEDASVGDTRTTLPPSNPPQTPPPPGSDGGLAPGDGCEPGKVLSQWCGQCGTRQATCVVDGGSKGTWSEFGACEGEKGECLPGATQSCGECGTTTCTNACEWSTTCTPIPNACQPGTVLSTDVGCPAGSYIQTTCEASCTWGAATACMEPLHQNKLTIPSNVTGSVIGSYALTADKVGKCGPMVCNAAFYSLATYPFEVIELTNPTPKTATVNVALFSPTVMQVLNTYPANLALQTDADLAACTGASLGASTSLTATIAPNAKILVRTSSNQPVTEILSTGNFTITVRTDSLE